MATPAPIDSGRYFWLVRLVSCLKRIPDFMVTSSKTGCSAGCARVAPKILATGTAASEFSKNERRLIFEGKLSLFSANWSRRIAGQVCIFLGEFGISQARIHLSQQAVDLQIDDSSRLRTSCRSFSIGTRLLVVLHSQ